MGRPKRKFPKVHTNLTINPLVKAEAMRLRINPVLIAAETPTAYESHRLADGVTFGSVVSRPPNPPNPPNRD